MKILEKQIPWFSIIEILIGIFVFSLGLVSIYALLASSLGVNDYNKNAIIASNLAREQIEIFRNIRDTNYKKLNIWNQINPEESYSTANFFSTGSYYTIENIFDTTVSFPSVVQDISLGFKEGEENLTGVSMQSYRLCMNSEGIYTYKCSGNISTPFYRYLFIEDLKDELGNTIIGAFQVHSKVIWYKRGYHEYEIKTIVTDWRRI